MPFIFKRYQVVLAFLLVLQMLPLAVFAQAGSAKNKANVLSIRKVTGLASKSRVKTPEYRSSVSGGVRNSGEWARVLVEYSTIPEWIDELVFQYHVMTLKVVGGKKSYSLFKVVVRYIDIPKDRRHLSTVFLRPNTVLRYGVPVAIAVEVILDGQVVAVKNDTVAAAGLPKGEWWKNPQVIDNEKVVTVRDGYLLNRSESPFALVNIDNYEVIK